MLLLTMGVTKQISRDQILANEHISYISEEVSSKKPQILLWKIYL